MTVEDTMKDIDEVVDLPDPDVQPMVHPLDLPQGRRPFVQGWLAASLGDPAIALAVAALVWFVSRQVFAPILAGGSLIVFGTLAGRHFTEEAWAYIPRRRQDRRRALPLSLEVGTSLVSAMLLAGVLVLTVVRLGQPDVPLDVRRFTIGMAVGAAGVVVVGLLIEAMRRDRQDRRRTWLKLPGVVVVVGSVAVALPVWFDEAASAWTSLSSGGAAAMALIGAGAGAWHLLRRRRDTA